MNLIFYMHLAITALNGMWNGNGPYESGLELGEWEEGWFANPRQPSLVALSEVLWFSYLLQIRLIRAAHITIRIKKYTPYRPTIYSFIFYI